MKRQIKILGFAALAALFVVSWGSPGAGRYIALKAKFVYNDAFEILNGDNAPAVEYPYADSGKPQGSPWLWFDSGSGGFRMTIARNSNTAWPYVKVLMNSWIEPPGNYQLPSLCAVYAGTPNVPGNIRWFWFTSGQEVRDNDGDGIMDNIGYPTLNLKDMNVNDIRYCNFACRFQTFDNQCEYDWGIPASGPATADNIVKVEVISEGGTKVWMITPYVGTNGVDEQGNPIVVQDCSKRKLMRAIYTKKSGAGYGGYCDAGVWDADFELRIALK